MAVEVLLLFSLSGSVWGVNSVESCPSSPPLLRHGREVESLSGELLEVLAGCSGVLLVLEDCCLLVRGVATCWSCVEPRGSTFRLSRLTKMACFPCHRYKLDCNPRCDFLERFSQPNQVQQFEAVDFVFGFDRVRRMMQGVPEEKKKDFIQSIVVEAKHRRQDLTSGFFGIARKKVQELQSEEEEAKREISQLQQEKSEGLGKISQLQGENAEALGKILLLQREKEEAFEKIQRLLKEKEESKRATEDHILQLRQTLKEDFEKYLIRTEQLFHQRTTQPGLSASGERAENQNARPTTMPYHPDEPILNLLDQEFAGASATEPRVGVEQSPFICGPNKTSSSSHGLRWIYRFLWRLVEAPITVSLHRL